QDLALGVHRDLARQVAARHRGGHLGEAADLPGAVRRHRVDRVGQVGPGAGDAGHLRLAAELALGADLARHARDFRGEAVELVDHRVDGVLELGDLAAHVHRDLARQVAARHGRGHLGDVAHLAGEVGRHRVDVIGQVLPGAGHVGDLRLSAELAFGTHFARHAGHFRGEAVELVDHRVDGVLELGDLAAHVHGDLARQVAARHRGRHLGDVAHLAGEVGSHRVDRVGQVLPGAGHAGHDRLSPNFALAADFARHAGHFRGEAAQLVDHRVDGLLELQDLAAYVHGDLAREVAIGDRDGHLGDVAHLGGEVGRHLVDRIGQVLPHAGYALDLCLSAEAAGCADLRRHARDLGAELAHLLDHAVDDRCRAHELALQRAAVGFQRHAAGQVALGDAGNGFGDGRDRAHQVVDQFVDRAFHFAPAAVAVGQADALPGQALAADLLADPAEL